ncbi:hypothetical protein LJB76_00190 [Clostridia bacterium OttesenSCG-928-O13]|nr:hypothetical protein [Clostridia bacterium OttesenSCG-928-O13]
MSESALNQSERNKAERIRRQYISREANKLEQLHQLDGKVKGPGRIAASIVGSVGALTMGGGMSLIMEWGNMTAGLPLGIAGLLLALLAYPIYLRATAGRKKKYADEIIRLSEEVMAE